MLAVLESSWKKGTFLPVDTVVLIEKKQFEDKVSRKVIETREKQERLQTARQMRKGRGHRRKSPRQRRGLREPGAGGQLQSCSEAAANP